MLRRGGVNWMLKLVYFAIGTVNLVLLLVALRLWRDTRLTTHLLIILPLAFLWYDNYTIAAGIYLGAGPLLEAMSMVRFLAHYLLLPALFIVAGSFARQAGYRWARPRSVMGGLCLLAAGFAAWETLEFLRLEIYPVCLGDTLRYSTSVNTGQACEPGMEGMGAAVPLAGSITLVLLFLALGLLLWRSHRWPWLFAATLTIFVLAGIPSSVAGPFLSNLGEPVFNAGLLATAVFLGKAAKKAAAPGPAAAGGGQPPPP
jgi:hypothetical protein